MGWTYRFVAAAEIEALVASPGDYVPTTSLGTMAGIRGWLMSRPDFRNLRSGSEIVITLGGGCYAVIRLRSLASFTARAKGEAAVGDEEGVMELEITGRGGGEPSNVDPYNGRVLADMASFVDAGILDCQSGDAMTSEQFRGRQVS